MESGLSKYNVVKLIGKGSFSNVYLCQENNGSSLLGSFFSKSNACSGFFIIKQVIIDDLVVKYTKSRKITTEIKKPPQQTKSMSITPYKTNLPPINSTEEEHYTNRLKNLIESEIEILKQIHHPNITEFYSSDLYQNIYYIKLEYCQYGDLYNILKEQTHQNEFKNRNIFNGFDNDFIKQFIFDTVNGLKYIHDLNIIHRDIKLHNILLKRKKSGSNYEFKISDFGFACIDPHFVNNKLRNSEIEFDYKLLEKKYYKLCGTPYYMAPEIILNIVNFEMLFEDNVPSKNLLYDNKIDLWSYGVCLFELIFNMLPFGNTVIEDVNDLCHFFSNSKTQKIIFKNIDKKVILDDHVKILLKRLLTINQLNRISTNELLEFTTELQDPDYIKKHQLINDSTIDDILNSTENSYTVSESVFLKTKLDPTLPLSEKSEKSKLEQSWTTCETKMNEWDYVNKASSLIMKVSVDNTFMKWLLKKKN